MIQSEFAILSPIDKTAGWLYADQSMVILTHPPEAKGTLINSRQFAKRFPDSKVVVCKSELEITQELAESQENSLALDFSLLLFDCELSDDVRIRIARELESIFDSNMALTYVLDILLASPLSSHQDFSRVKQLARPFESVAKFVQAIEECQDRVRHLQNAWFGMADDPMVRSSGFNELYGVLIHFGVFRRLARATSKAQLLDIKPKILMDGNLIERCDARILSSFISQYGSSLPVGKPKTRDFSPFLGEEEDRPVRTQGKIGKTRFDARTIKSGLLSKQGQAQRQVAKIAELFAQKNDVVAGQFLEELIASQSANELDHVHLVKSLCNVAQRCVTAGRRDVNFQCLKRALEYPEGVDAKLYIQIGLAFCDNHDFEKALDCYEKATQKDDGELSDRIRNETIRVFVAKGDYQLALQKYLAIDALNSDPYALCGLATLRRKTGHLKLARSDYERVLKLDANGHAAIAGLAEVYKQQGDVHRSIAVYNSLISKKDNIDERAMKVYDLNRSSLLRMTGQFDVAIAVLQKIALKYPFDPDVNLQLARVFALKENKPAAEHHFSLARRPSNSIAAEELFAVAMRYWNESYQKPSTQSNLILDSYLPEDRGVASCRYAVQAISSGKLEEAISVVSKGIFVDRIHKDFGDVLCFHARRIQGHLESDHRSHQNLCLIAKRGFKPLRLATQAIISGHFDVAIRHEEQMCLLVA